MSLRDELAPVRTGYKSRADMWLEEQSAEFKAEFNDLLYDTTVGHSQLLRLCKRYGLQVEVGAFTTWRKNQWASKTN